MIQPKLHDCDFGNVDVSGTSDEDGPLAQPLQFGGRQCPQFLNIYINTFFAESEKYEYVTFHSYNSISIYC
jgi:hypothetical protein